MAAEYFLLQTSDLQQRQVSRGMLSGAPQWWRLRFLPAPESFTLKPLGEEKGLKIYGIDVPVRVLDAFFEMIQVPENISDYWRHAPLKLKDTTSLQTWRGYMRSYGFSDREDLLDREDDAEQPPLKKARILSPYDEKLIRVAKGLHAYIMTGHPKAADFLAGRIGDLFCHFVVQYNSAPSVAPLSFEFSHPDLAPGTDEAIIGYLLIGKLQQKQVELFIDTMTSECSVGTKIHVVSHHIRNEKSKSNQPVACRHWPLSPNDRTEIGVTHQHHSVTALVFKYQ